MEAINHSLFHNNKLANLLAQTSQGGLYPQYGVNTRTKARAELEITTAEGDRVTLLSQSKLWAAYAGYDSQGKLTGTESSVSTNIYQIVTTNNVAIAVEGNLNEEELADIRNLLQSVEDIFMNFISGDGTMEENLAASLSLDSMTTLSHFDAELKYSQKIEGFGITTGSAGQPDTTTPQESSASETAIVAEEGVDATPDITTLMAFKAKSKASLHLSGTRLTLDEPALNTTTSILPETGSTATLPSAETAVIDPVMNSVSMINMEAKLRTSIKLKVAQSLLNSAPAAVSATPQEPSAPAVQTQPVQAPADTAGTPVSADSATAQNQAADTSSANPGTLSSLSTSRIKLLEEIATLVRQTSMDFNTISTVFSRFIPGLIDQLNNNYTIDESQKGEIAQMGEDILNTVQSTSPEVTQ